MNIILLTHKKELAKKTNTGSLVVDFFPENAQVIIWDRVKPDPTLLELINNGSVALLYPVAGSELVSEAIDYNNYIIIDGTWQQAQKIYNHSPYLKDLPTVKVAVDNPSAYHLRRNQRAGCLCTAECVIELLKCRGFLDLSRNLQHSFDDFLSLKKKQ